MNILKVLFIMVFTNILYISKSYSTSLIELDMNWFGSDWYYQNDISYDDYGGMNFWLIESFDSDQKTIDSDGRVIIYDTILSNHNLYCAEKTVRSDEIVLMHDRQVISQSKRLFGFGYHFPKIDIPFSTLSHEDFGFMGIDDRGVDLAKLKALKGIKWSSLLKSPFKKFCKIYD